MAIKGIDVSEFQGDIDWSEVKDAGIEFAIIKLANIYDFDDNYKDSKFDINYKNVKAQGIKVGAYNYNYSNTIDTLNKGVKWALEQLEGKELELPIYLDMEDKDIQEETIETLTNLCNEFAKTIEEGSYRAGVYANLNWLENKLNPSDFDDDISVWVAQYYTECQYEGEYNIWQYSSSGKVSGVSGNCDMNYLYDEDIIEDTEPTNDNNKKSVDELAQEVLEGKWGNGKNRKKKLENAGYNYDEVQNRVNEILGVNVTKTYTVKKR